MEFNKWLDEYINDERTANFYGNWNIKLKRDEAFADGIEQRNYDIAKNLLNLKTDLNTISKATGLSINDIKKLK